MTKPKLPEKRKYNVNCDWEAVWPDFQAGIMSLREVARKHNIDPTHLGRKAKELGIERDLTHKIKQAVKIKLAKSTRKQSTKKATQLTKKATKKCYTPNTDAIIEQQSDKLVEIQLLHREDINGFRLEEIRLLKMLGDNPKKLWIGQYQGKIVEKETSIPVTEQAQALNNLASAISKRITLERAAFSMDESPAEVDDLKTSLSGAEKQALKKAALIVARRVIENVGENE